MEDGSTYHPEDFRTGVEEFLSEEGYRLSFNIDGVVITLRKGSIGDDLRAIDEYLPQQSVDCAVTIRGLRSSLDETDVIET
jgi:hypothetical protein